MELAFKILAAILAGVAAYFLWHGNAERAFVAAVGGAVSFFLSVRVQVKGRLKQRELEREEEEMRRREEEETEEDFEDEDFEDETFELNEMPAREEIRGERRTTDHEPKI